MVLFAVTPEAYPQFDKDNLLNRQADPATGFDLGPFLQLEEDMRQLREPPSVFAYVFSAPGTWVLKSSSGSSSSTTVFAVMTNTTACPELGPFFPATTSNQLRLGVRKETDIIVAPDWVLIGIIVAVCVALLVVFIAAIIAFRRWGWSTNKAAGTLQYRKAALAASMDAFASKGSQLYRVQRTASSTAVTSTQKGAATSDVQPTALDAATSSSSSQVVAPGILLSRRRNTSGHHGAQSNDADDADSVGDGGALRAVSDGFWDYARQVDIEGFSFEDFVALLRNHSTRVTKQLADKAQDLHSQFDSIREQTDVLKAMWVSRLNAARPLDVVPSESTESVAQCFARHKAALKRRQKLAIKLKPAVDEQIKVVQDELRAHADLLANLWSRLEAMHMLLDSAGDRGQQHGRRSGHAGSGRSASYNEAVLQRMRSLLDQLRLLARSDAERRLCPPMSGEEGVTGNVATGGSLGSTLDSPGQPNRTLLGYTILGLDLQALPRDSLVSISRDGKRHLLQPDLLEEDGRTGLIYVRQGTPLCYAGGAGHKSGGTKVVAVERDRTFVLNCVTGRALPIEGNVVYDVVTGQLVVSTQNPACPSWEGCVPFLPFPDSAPTQALAAGRGAAGPPGDDDDDSSDHDWRTRAFVSDTVVLPHKAMRDRKTGLSVPVVAVTAHPVTGRIVPLGGTVTDAFTGLPSVMVMGQPMLVGDTISLIGGFAIDADTGEVMPVPAHLKPGRFQALLSNIKDPVSGLSAAVSGITLTPSRRARTTPADQRHVPRTPLVTVGGAWSSHCAQQHMCVSKLIDAASEAVAAISSQGPPYSLRWHEQAASLRQELENASRSIESFLSYSFAHFQQVSETISRVSLDGGTIGSIAMPNNSGSDGSEKKEVPLFIGQILRDKVTGVEVPVLGIDLTGTTQALGGKTVPLAGTYVEPGGEVQSLAPIMPGRRFIDEAGHVGVIHGARLDEHTGSVVPSTARCMSPRLYLTSVAGTAAVSLASKAGASNVLASRRLLSQLTLAVKHVQDMTTSCLSAASASHDSVGQGPSSHVSADPGLSQYVLAIESQSDNLRRIYDTLTRLHSEERSRLDELAASSELSSGAQGISTMLESLVLAPAEHLLQLACQGCEAVRSIMDSVVMLTSKMDQAEAQRRAMKKSEGAASGDQHALAEHTYQVIVSEVLDNLQRDAEHATLTLADVIGECRAMRTRQEALHRLVMYRLQQLLVLSRLQRGERDIDVSARELRLLEAMNDLIMLLQGQGDGVNAPPVQHQRRPSAGRSATRGDMKQDMLKRRDSGSALAAERSATAADNSIQPAHVPTVTIADVEDTDAAEPNLSAVKGRLGTAGLSSGLRTRPSTPRGGPIPGAKMDYGPDSVGSAFTGDVAQASEQNAAAVSRLHVELCREEEKELNDLGIRQASLYKRSMEELASDYAVQLEGALDDPSKRHQLLQTFAKAKQALERKLDASAAQQRSQLRERLVEQRMRRMHTLRQKQLSDKQGREDGRQVCQNITREQAERVVDATCELAQSSAVATMAATADSCSMFGASEHSPSDRQTAVASMMEELRHSQPERVANIKSSVLERLLETGLERQAAAMSQVVSLLESEGSDAADQALAAALRQRALHSARANVIKQAQHDFGPEAAHLLSHALDQHRKLQAQSQAAADKARDEAQARRLAMLRLQERKQRRNFVADALGGTLKREGTSGNACDEEDANEELDQAHLDRLAELESQARRAMALAAAQADEEAKRLEEEANTALANRQAKLQSALDSMMAQQPLTSTADGSSQEAKAELQKHKAQVERLRRQIEDEKSQQMTALKKRLADRKQRRLVKASSEAQAGIDRAMLALEDELSERRRKARREAEDKFLKGILMEGTPDSMASSLEAGDKESRVFQALNARHRQETLELLTQLQTERSVLIQQELAAFDRERLLQRDKLEAAQAQELGQLLVVADDLSKGVDAGDVGERVSRQMAEQRVLVQKHQQQLNSFDRKTAALRSLQLGHISAPIDARQARKRLHLRQQQYREMAEAFRKVSPETQLVEEYEKAAAEAEAAATRFKEKVERETDEKIVAIRAEQERQRQAKQAKLNEQIAALEAELDAERSKQEERMRRAMQHREEQELLRRQMEQQQKLQQLGEAEQQAMMEQHRQELQALQEMQKSNRAKQEQALRKKLEARRAAKRAQLVRQLETKAQEEQEDAEVELLQKATLNTETRLAASSSETLDNFGSDIDDAARPRTPRTFFRQRQGRSEAKQGVIGSQGQTTLHGETGSSYDTLTRPGSSTEMAGVLDKVLKPLLVRVRATLLGEVMSTTHGELDSLDRQWAIEDENAVNNDDLTATVVDVSKLSTDEKQNLSLCQRLAAASLDSKTHATVKAAVKLPTAGSLLVPYPYSYRVEVSSKRAISIFVRRERLANAPHCCVVFLHALAHAKVLSDGQMVSAANHRRALEEVLSNVFETLASQLQQPSASNKR